MEAHVANAPARAPVRHLLIPEPGSAGAPRSQSRAGRLWIRGTGREEEGRRELTPPLRLRDSQPERVQCTVLCTRVDPAARYRRRAEVRESADRVAAAEQHFA